MILQMKKAKILLCHNHYQQAGGESLVFENEVRGLRSNGHEVIEYIRSNAEISGFNFRQKAGMVAEAYASNQTEHELERLVNETRPDLAIVQNVFPLLSPSVYIILNKLHIPVIQVAYNFRFICPQAELYTEGAICERCLEDNLLQAVRHRCYHHSFLQSAWYASIIGFHRMNGTFIQCIDAYLTPDHFMAGKFVQGGLPALKMHVAPNPFFVPPDPGSSVPQRYVLFAGRWVTEKGVPTLLKAMQKVASDVHLVMVGTGELEPWIQSQLIESRLDSRVTLLGPRWGDELLDLIRQCMAVVIPSEWYDSLPLILCQANAMSRPVIASRINGIPEYIREGVNGFLFEPGDVESLAETIDRLASMSASEHIALSRSSRQYAETELDYPVHYARLNQLMIDLLGGNG